MKIKTCNCCNKIHKEIPVDARYDQEIPSYYWECECKSTLAYFFVTPEEISQIIRNQTKTEIDYDKIALNSKLDYLEAA